MLVLLLSIIARITCAYTKMLLFSVVILSALKKNKVKDTFYDCLRFGLF